MSTSIPPNWRVIFEAPRTQGLKLLSRGMTRLLVSLLPLGALAWFGLELQRGGYRLQDDFGNTAFVNILLTVVFVIVALGLGLTALRGGVGALLDGLGLERKLEGAVSELSVDTWGEQTLWSMYVGGHRVVIPRVVFEQLRDGQQVWLRAGRFEYGLKALARPAGETPAGLGF